MKRDDNLIRALLLKYEAEDDWLLMMPGETDSSSKKEERRERYHVLLMSDIGFVTDVGRGTFRLTAQGHDFIDAIRSDDVWQKTKDGESAIGGATLGILRDLAVAYLKQSAAQKLGINL